jgi:hypothetical protein
MDFTHKAHFVAEGHMTDPPNNITYSSVVARDSVQLAFLKTALNDLEILGHYIGNAYLQAETNEKVHTMLLRDNLLSSAMPIWLGVQWCCMVEHLCGDLARYGLHLLSFWPQCLDLACCKK